MPTYKESVDVVSAQATKVLEDLWSQMEHGALSRDDFDYAAAAVLDTAAARSAHLADAALAARLSELTGQETEPLGLAAPDTGAVAEVSAITAGVGVSAALGLAARSATRAAGQAIWSQGLQDHGVPGWRRVHSGSDCEPCTKLAVAEFISSNVTMWMHKGCGCHPDPVVDDPQAVSGPVLVQGQDF